MKKRITIDDRTYTRLDAFRREGETFDQAVIRLLDSQKKDPLGFVKRMTRPDIDPDEWLAQIEADRESTRMDA